jgi:dipeptidyl aminopeptidase/acylaminoacyl peptidase
MNRPSGGTLGIVASGTVVVVAAMWAQWQVVGDSETPAETRVAVIERTHADSTESRLVVRTYPDEQTRVVREGTSPLVEPNWSPDGTKLAFVELDREGEDLRLVIWDYGTGRQITHPLPPLVGANGLWWSPDSKVLVVPGTTTLAFSRTGTALFSEPAGWSTTDFSARRSFDHLRPAR